LPKNSAQFEKSPNKNASLGEVRRFRNKRGFFLKAVTFIIKESPCKINGGKKMEKTITIPYSADRFDQWRLSQAGGQISFNKAGIPIFQFKNAKQYHQYLELNAQRENFMKGEVR
jgi:hypothetical protein